PSSVTKIARTSPLSAKKRPASCALAPAASVVGSGTIASRTISGLIVRILDDSGVDTASLERRSDLADRGHHGCLAQRDLLVLGHGVDAVERVAHLVGEFAPDLVAVPEQAAEVLHPLEVRDSDAAGVREDVRHDGDAALAEDLVGLDRRRTVCT